MGIRGRERNPWKETKRKQKERKFQPRVSLKASLSSRENGATGRRHQEKKIIKNERKERIVLKNQIRERKKEKMRKSIED